MVDGIEGIFNVKVENYSLAFVPTKLVQNRPQLGELPPSAAISAEPFPCIIEQLMIFSSLFQAIIVNGSGNDKFCAFARNGALIRHQ